MGQPDWEAEFVEYLTAQHGPLRRLAYALCGDWPIADDAVQHTFVQLYRHWRRVQPTSLDSYARTILVNAVRSLSRHRQRETTTADPPDSTATPIDSDIRIDVRRALARLPRRQREMVVLRHLENLSERGRSGAGCRRRNRQEPDGARRRGPASIARRNGDGA